MNQVPFWIRDCLLYCVGSCSGITQISIVGNKNDLSTFIPDQVDMDLSDISDRIDKILSSFGLVFK